MVDQAVVKHNWYPNIQLYNKNIKKIQIGSNWPFGRKLLAIGNPDLVALLKKNFEHKETFESLERQTMLTDESFGTSHTECKQIHSPEQEPTLESAHSSIFESIKVYE